ncbi:MAG: hypothetical protein KAV87_31415 [Desulfobacteraceae bacterium]|nr:hypothetical protein [Desulfobacteraceae bacterium]
MLTNFEIDRMNDTSGMTSVYGLWKAGWSTYAIAIFRVCSEAEVYNWLFGEQLR